MKLVGIVDDARFLDHNRGAGHIEGPERLEAVREMIAAGLPFAWRRVEPRPATDEELAAIHDPRYIGLLARTAGRPYVQLDAGIEGLPGMLLYHLHGPIGLAYVDPGPGIGEPLFHEQPFSL